jgi:hypothetical protein
VEAFEAAGGPARFSAEACRRNAERFSREAFRGAMKGLVERLLAERAAAADGGRGWPGRGTMRFTLIVATRGRTSELSELFDSLAAQGRGPGALEVIVVDQNGDDRLAPVIEGHAGRLTLRWIRSAVANACHARNLGLAAARGAVVAFPDDDCTYPPGVLDRVEAAFGADPGLAVLTGPRPRPPAGWDRGAGAGTPAPSPRRTSGPA